VASLLALSIIASLVFPDKEKIKQAEPAD
jgi:hypothetical protein